MPENLRVMVEHALPFMVAAANGKGPKLNTARVLEQLLLAAVLGAGAWLFLVPKLELEFRYMQKELHSVGNKLETMQKDVEQLKIEAAVQRAHHPSPPQP